MALIFNGELCLFLACFPLYFLTVVWIGIGFFLSIDEKRSCWDSWEKKNSKEQVNRIKVDFFLPLLRAVEECGLLHEQKKIK